MIYNETLNTIPLNDYKNVCGYCTLYIVLFVVFLVTSTAISFDLFFISIQKRILQIPITSVNEDQLFF